METHANSASHRKKPGPSNARKIQEAAAALEDFGNLDTSTQEPFQAEADETGGELLAHATTLNQMGDPNDSLGASFHVDFQDTVSEAGTTASTRETPAASNRVRTGGTGGGTNRIGTAGAGPPQEPHPPGETWFGLETATTGDRMTTQDETRARFLNTVGWHVRRVFDNKPDADRWVAQATPHNQPVDHNPRPRVNRPSPAPPTPPPESPGSPPRLGNTPPRPFYGLEHPTYGDRTLDTPCSTNIISRLPASSYT